MDNNLDLLELRKKRLKEAQKKNNKKQYSSLPLLLRISYGNDRQDLLKLPLAVVKKFISWYRSDDPNLYCWQEQCELQKTENNKITQEAKRIFTFIRREDIHDVAVFTDPRQELSIKDFLGEDDGGFCPT